MTPSRHESQRPNGVRRSTCAWRRGVALCAALVAQACGDAVSPSRGSVAGTVVLQDSWANRLDNFSGVTVTVDGLSTIALSDSAGGWYIDGVPAGRHTITFKRATFGTVQLLTQNVTGPSTTLPNVTMALTPWQQAVIDSVYAATKSGTLYYFVDGHLSAPPPANARLGYTVAFFGKNGAVSPDTTSFAVWASAVDVTGKSSKFSITLPASTALSTFGAGGQMFVAAYTSAIACNCYPQDASGGKPFFSNTGPRANVLQLTVK